MLIIKCFLILFILETMMFFLRLYKCKNYNARLHEIPVSFIYPIVIAFLLLLIFLPIIKFYLIGNDETVKLVDITLSVFRLLLALRWLHLY